MISNPFRTAGLSIIAVGVTAGIALIFWWYSTSAEYLKAQEQETKIDISEITDDLVDEYAQNVSLLEASGAVTLENGMTAADAAREMRITLKRLLELKEIADRKQLVNRIAGISLVVCGVAVATGVPLLHFGRSFAAKSGLDVTTALN